MDQALLNSIGALLLGAVPTIILFLLLWAAYRFLLDIPLQRVLAERYQRTEGALAKSKTDIATAAAKAAEYEQRMREARQSIFKAQEARRKKWTEIRESALLEVRKRAGAMLDEARAALEKDVAQTK